jgi:hypothetical protein
MKPSTLVTLGVSLSTLPVGPGAVSAQRPLVQIAAVDSGTVQVALARRSYLLLVEYRPGVRPRVLYPGVESEWSPADSGIVVIRATIRLLKRGRAVSAPAPQCIVGLASATSWNPESGARQGRDLVACGPLPTIRSYEGGYGPWEDWRTPHYDFAATLDPYLLVVAFDADAPPFSLAILGTILNQTPVDVAQGIGGSLSPRPNDPVAWQAAFWMRR